MAAMDRCETCRHWVQSDEWDVKAGGLRTCRRVEPKWTVEDRVPEAIREGKYEAEDAALGYDLSVDEKRLAAAYTLAAEDIFKAARAVVNDGSQYRAELLTRPDFGCVLHDVIDPR